jgi:steroid 5-alpha reductase family enzyme
MVKYVLKMQRRDREVGNDVRWVNITEQRWKPYVTPSTSLFSTADQLIAIIHLR